VLGVLDREPPLGEAGLGVASAAFDLEGAAGVLDRGVPLDVLGLDIVVGLGVVVVVLGRGLTWVMFGLGVVVGMLGRGLTWVKFGLGGVIGVLVRLGVAPLGVAGGVGTPP
jgi:hypothetical protein